MKTQKKFSAGYGAAAIDELLRRDGIAERENIILHCVPVVPMCMRYAHLTKEESVCGQEHFVPLALNTLYNRVIIRNGRITRLQGLNCPEIILRNESRMLQEAVDALVSNGLRGLPVCVDDHYPAHSLNELSELIRETKGAEKAVPETHIRRQEFLDAIMAAETYRNENDLEGVQMDDDDPRLAEITKLTDNVKSFGIPYAEEYIRLNYSNYRDAAENAVQYAIATLAKTCCSWQSRCDKYKKKLEDEIDEFTDGVEIGIRKHIDIYFHKCVMWEKY